MLVVYTELLDVCHDQQLKDRKGLGAREITGRRSSQTRVEARAFFAHPSSAGVNFPPLRLNVIRATHQPT